MEINFWLIICTSAIWIFVWIFTNPSANTFSAKLANFKTRLITKDPTHTGQLVLLMFFVLLVGSKIAHLPDFPAKNVIILIGAILNLTGLVICIWAKLEMRENWGEPATFDKKRQTALVTSGPYTFSRNPIYLGILVMFVGAGLALYTWAILAVMALWFHFNKIIDIEEKNLLKHFPKEFAKYSSKTPKLFLLK